MSPSPVFALVSLWLAFAPRAASRNEDPAPRFPVAAAADVGLDPGRLEALARFVAGLAERDQVPGAELLVIRKEKTVLHRAFGWKDRETKVAMEPGTIFCVRSMTKPVAGTAVEMLIDEKKLGLQDQVSKHLPSFDNDRSRAITVEMLLHHRGGLPLSGLIAKELSSVPSLRSVADAAGEQGPELPPGTRFSYSDDGADTLGALVEVASGERLEAFLQKRVFEPLGMRETIAFVATDHPLRGRIASNYAGAPGAWTRYWSPKDPPLFPFLLASQALYCTAEDYASFLALWKAKGSPGGKRLVTARSVRRALEPGVESGFPCGFAGLSVDYGELWMLYVDRSKPEKPELVAFGHNGSDGTFAYCFPGLDLIVLFFTQARGTTCGPAFEAELQKELVDPLLRTERAPPVSYSEADLDRFAGEYWNAEHEELVALVRRGGALWVELPGRASLELSPTPVRDRFVIALKPSEAFSIERGEEGAVLAVVGHSKRPAGEAFSVRFEPLVAEEGVPTAAELEALRKGAVDWEKIAALGACRIKGTIDMPARKISGTFTTVAQGIKRFRMDLDLGATQASVAFDGEHATTQNSRTGSQELSGVALEQTRFDHPFRRIADWTAFFSEMRVLRRVVVGDRATWLVRCKTPSGTMRSLYVDVEKHRIVAEAFVALVPGAGEIGVWIDYADWREVDGGIELPFHVKVEYASPLLGTTTSQWETFEPHVEVEESAFRLEAAK